MKASKMGSPAESVQDLKQRFSMLAKDLLQKSFVDQEIFAETYLQFA